MTNKEINVKNIDKAEAAKRAKGYYGDYSTEARIAYSSFLDGCDWKEQQVIDRASEWLIENYPTNDGGELYVFIKEFKKAMQGV